MTGLPKSIIKKYGITKKAWSVYRGKKTKSRSVVRVAKRRKVRRYKARGLFKRRRKSKGLGGGITGIVIGGVAYGAGRQYISNLIAPLTSKLPLGQYADNVAMGLVSWALATGKIPLIKKIPMSRDIGKAGLAIEAAFAGQDLLGKSGTGGTGNSGVFIN